MGLAVFANWAANFAVSQTFPVFLKSWGPGPVFLGYAAIGVIAFVFVKFLVPETKGRSLEEIEEGLLRKAGEGEGEGEGDGDERRPRPERVGAAH
jgi:hypothetical protein